MSFMNGSGIVTLIERQSTCKPWCRDHAVLDDNTPFCNAADLPVYLREAGGQGAIALTCFPDEEPRIMLDIAAGPDSLTVGEAEHLAKQIMRQVARARGEETP